MPLATAYLRRAALASAVLLVATTAVAAPFAYVPNEKAGTLSILDTATDKVVGDIEVGVKPRGIAASSASAATTRYRRRRGVGSMASSLGRG